MARAPAGIKRPASRRVAASGLAALALTLAVGPAAAAWPPYGVQLGSTYFWFNQARVYPNPDGGASLGYFERFGGTQLDPNIQPARVAGDGSTLVLGPSGSMIWSDLSP